MKKKNEGFTLVELIVSIAILAIVGVGIGTIIYQGTKQYRTSNVEVNLQQESQIVGNQLTYFVLTANDGVSLNDGKLNIYHFDATEKQRSKNVIAFDAASGMLTYTQYVWENESNEWVIADGTTEECLAEYVADFSVKFLDASGAEITVTADEGSEAVNQVCVEIAYELDGRSYDYAQTITLRNQVLASNIGDTVSESDDGEDGNKDSETEEDGNKDSETEEDGNKDSETEEDGNKDSETEEDGNKDSETEEDGNKDSETEEPEMVVSSISVEVPHGNSTRESGGTTTATITLKGTNLPTDERKEEVKEKLSLTMYYSSGGRWKQNPSGISISDIKITAATATQYTITCKITLDKGKWESYRNSECLKLVADYENLETSDTFYFKTSGRW